MQMILNEGEFATYQLYLKQKKIDLEKLQKLCSLAAKYVPVDPDWFEEPGPWGCILDSGSDWYCDECPAKDVCPYEQKEWSK